MIVDPNELVENLKEVVAQLNDHVTRALILLDEAPNNDFINAAKLHLHKIKTSDVPATRTSANAAHGEFCKDHYRLKKNC